ncbi:hypothetical protein AB1L42_18910 [Thalassoglobus sp. JC818]|uniref:hypothetical protein n=1 Tax=Thalassoglobus sp. JC818 TaxID=3232136 RepID=UPI003458ED0F
MSTGLETLASIDRAMHDVRKEIENLDKGIQFTNDQLSTLSEEESTRFRELAKARLDEMTQGAILEDLDRTDRQVQALLSERLVTLDDLQKQIEESSRLQTELEETRRAQQERVHAVLAKIDSAHAKTQARLANDPEHRDQLETAKKADNVAKHAEKKAEQADQDRMEKGQAYEGDPLFMYLWRRNYGTPEYSAGTFTRFLDNWVARLIKFPRARPNFAMLHEIPKRLKVHAREVRSKADQEFEKLRELEELASKEDGTPELQQELDKEQTAANDADRAIDKAEKHFSELLKKKSEFAGGDDRYSRQCLELFVHHFQREPLEQLIREAEQTRSVDDDLIVEQISQLRMHQERLQSELSDRRSLHLRHLKRLEDLEEVRREFKRHRYDDNRSDFPNSNMIGAMLREFLRGMANSGQLWNTIERSHRRRRVNSDPTFGSGGFGHRSGGTWNIPIPPQVGGSSRPSPPPHSGGSFRTGGGF